MFNKSQRGIGVRSPYLLLRQTKRRGLRGYVSVRAAWDSLALAEFRWSSVAVQVDCLTESGSKEASAMSKSFRYFRTVFVIAITLTNLVVAAAQTQPKQPADSGQMPRDGQVKLVPYKDVGWRPPSTGEKIMAEINNPALSFPGKLTVISKVTKGSIVTGADQIFVINQNDQIPGYKGDLVAGRLAIESLGGDAVKITSLDAKGFVLVFPCVVLSVGTEFEVEKMRWQKADFERGIITLREDGLEWKPTPQ